MKLPIPKIPLPTYLIALVWLINGLFCKILNLVPRHQEIVEKIIGEKIAVIATIGIGGLELLMTTWILSRIKIKLCAMTQIVTILLMNIIELLYVPELLLFGKFNIVIACAFCIFIYYFELLKEKEIQNN